MFYSLKDGGAMVEKLEGYIGSHPGVSYLKSRLREILRGVVLGYLMVALIQGVLGGLTFFLFGIPSPFFWGVVMAFLALIPYLGTGLVWIPASAIFFLNGIFQNSNVLILKGISLFLVGLVVISGIDNLLRPKLMGRKAKIHPLVILLGLLGGVFFFGPAGVIIGPLVLSLLILAVEFYAAANK